MTLHVFTSEVKCNHTALLEAFQALHTLLPLAMLHFFLIIAIRGSDSFPYLE